MSTTPRRSGRLSGKPLVIRKNKSNSTSDTYRWTSDPIHSRPSIRHDFIDDRDWEKAKGDDGDGDDEGEEDGRTIMTDFYDAFVVVGKKNAGKFTRFRKGVDNRKKKGKGKAKENEELYEIGDTILVTSANKLPSVGVIVGMWENRWEDERGEEMRRMVVKVHWFLRPTELPGIRAKREHAVVCMMSVYPSTQFD